MKIYIAHNFAARDYLRLQMIPQYFKGHEITSRWIFEPLEEIVVRGRERNAEDDLEDIKKADLLVICTDQFGERGGKGKWFEWGYVYALATNCDSADYEVITVGLNQDCVFYHLPNQKHFETWEQLGEHLAKLK